MPDTPPKTISEDTKVDEHFAAARTQERITSVSPKVTPEEAAKLIRFALSELSAENAHHDFEHLCRHLTRRRVCPNIIPATGPVAGGGDQGADFETYKVASSPEQSTFFSRATVEKWVFACSLEKNYKKKIRSDLAAAKVLGEPVSRLVFFHHLSIKTSDRHRLKKEALENYGIDLEIFDGPAIAEMLADRETAWIAQRYLSLPSEFVLLPESPPPTWFQAVIAKSYDPHRLTTADFFELKDAIRFATWHPEHHSDLDRLLGHIRQFRKHAFPRISRQAIYEEFVASLRGLETTTGLEQSLRDYFRDIDTLDDPADVEDGAVLVGYALGAVMREVLDLPISELKTWHEALTNRTKILLAQSTSAGRECAYLFVQGYLSFSRWMTTTNDKRTEFERSVESAVARWRTLVKRIPDSPLFPVHRLANLINELIVQLHGISGVSQLVRDVDELSVKRSGQHKLAEHHRNRAMAYVKDKQYIRALDELHRAHTSFTAETAFEAIAVCLKLSSVYAEMSLFFAAKYYSLAAVFAALKLPDEKLRQFAYIGCAEAASADHASGGSLLFYLTARLFMLITSEYSMGGSEERRQHEWARIDFYGLLLARGASLVFDRLQKVLVETVLPSLDQREIYDDSRDKLNGFFSDIGDAQALAAKATSQGIAPPFSDVGGRRKAAWRQMGINWHFEWQTAYDTDRQAQALAAYLQILLAEFARTELSIIPGEVFVVVQVHDKPLEIKEIADNEQVRRVVRLPRGAKDTKGQLPGIASAVASVLLKTVSALPEKRFLTLYTQQLKRGLMARLSVYRPSESLFDEFYDRESYSQIYAVGGSSFVRMPDYVIRTWEGLDGPQGTHSEYNRAESLKLVRNRYDRLAPLTRKTVARLITDESFRRTVATLRGEGWKDWHILSAIECAKFNYVLNKDPSLREAFDRGDQATVLKYRSRPEEEGDAEVPLEEFTAEQLKLQIKITQLSTLKGLGLGVWQSTPNFRGVDTLLRRFHYWDDDVPHSEVFPLPNAS
ncbi:MAG: hypothetical protein LAN70_11115 [Acidobacteriia bacterium]|nr:hypothetical protein [Terriglobia bacterium]